MFWLKMFLWRIGLIKPKFKFIEGEKNVVLFLFNKKFIFNVLSERFLFFFDGYYANECVVKIIEDIVSDNQHISENLSRGAVIQPYKNNIIKNNHKNYKIIKFHPKELDVLLIIYKYPQYIRVNGKLVNIIKELYLAWKCMTKKDINQLVFKDLIE